MEDSNSREILDSEMETMDLRSQESTDQVELESELPPEKEVITDDWRDAINKVVPAVVVLQTTACRSFDTELPSSGSATGFVVDKNRGIILTNRHVVKPGPVVAQAIFVNNEEIPVYPIYRDPVHDFGFFRYDPSEIQFHKYEEIPLAPEAATVGLEIRVIGNDSCEKVSILAGTLARLDRNAPTYRRDGYNDFNTFYMQAASGTKRGSSGSPVIDKQGRAVALNAGGSVSSSSAFYLHLERVVRALAFLQKSKDASIPRGTLQVTFLHKGFDETRRLGLPNETEQMVRQGSAPGETGMLVVDSVVPCGPADRQLESGDVLVRVNGEVTTQFLKLEALLDDSVDKKIELQIERGGTSLTVSIVVQDLHSITPDCFLEVSGAVIHRLSYQQARNFCFQCGLVYVSDPGYMLSRAGIPRHAIIKKFANDEISQLEDVISVLSKLCRGDRVPLEYISYKDRHRRKSTLVTIDRHEWYNAPKIYTRDDSSGLWMARPAIQPTTLQLSPCSSDVTQGLNSQASSLNSESTPAEGTDQANNQELTHDIMRTEAGYEHISEEAHSREECDVKTNKQQVQGNLSSDEIAIADRFLLEIGEMKLETPGTTEITVSNGYEGAIAAATNASFAERVVEPTLVTLEVNVPPSCLLDGIHSLHSSGTGVVVHHSQDMGLVAIDKNTVETSACDVMLSFAAFPIEIPGEVVFLHPVYNYALVGYDPSALGAVGASMVRAAELLPEPALCRGDPIYLIGLSKNQRAKSRKSIVTNPYVALNFGYADRPRYRAINMEVIELDTDFGNAFTGVLCNEHGKVRAIWGSFSNKPKSSHTTSKDYQFVRGVPIYMISQVLDKIISGANGASILINGVKRSMPLVRTLEVELCSRLLSKARSFGLGDEWIQRLVKKDPMRRQVLRVKGCLAGSNTENLLKQGDMLLAINKEPVTCFQDVENACQALENCVDSDGKLKITICRQGGEVDLFVGTDIRDGNGTTRAVNWCGCLVQDPHPAVRALGFLPGEGHGVYAAMCCRGSPADRYALGALRWIVQVNGKPTPDLDAFVNVTKGLRFDEFVRVKTINLDGKPRVLTLKQDLHYWPTWELRFDPNTARWRRETIKALDCNNE
ncbi:PREDICTED: protease Do-like 7 [Populus euphratica]|uniref:Pro-apoptotic serine protease NMA111 n=1 Tax=Populus euphratica TaxID=75702 RepID=A0AAJ6T936_POPEU|nr:PREDICTED: protease Do-like 7 [Populus euphratica]